MRFLILACCAFLMTGCLANAALDLATLPVKAVGKAVDLATTSQSEADRNRGREARKNEEYEEKEKRRREKEARKQAKEDARDAEDD
jgi:predicted Holliday junction resolvase-like endonuclease